jgi:hypothetical protein
MADRFLLLQNLHTTNRDVGSADHEGSVICPYFPVNKVQVLQGAKTVNQPPNHINTVSKRKTGNHISMQLPVLTAILNDKFTKKK